MLFAESVIAMRRRGVKPALVWVDVDGGREWSSMLRDCNQDGRANPWVVVEAGDSMERLDLRWVIGLDLFVMGESESRVRDFFAEAQDNGAGRVVAFAGPHILDTKGILTTHQEAMHG